MKVSSLITLIAALGATALLSCCTFAGYNTGTLSNVAMFTVSETGGTTSLLSNNIRSMLLKLPIQISTTAREMGATAWSS